MKTADFSMLLPASPSVNCPSNNGSQYLPSPPTHRRREPRLWQASNDHPLDAGRKAGWDRKKLLSRTEI